MAPFCRYRDDPVRMREYRKYVKGKAMDNHKSCNLNSTFRLMWPDANPDQNFVRPRGPPWGSAASGLSDKDIIIVLDADQECHIDFLTEVLPCFKAGTKEDNLVLVQTPQVRRTPSYHYAAVNGNGSVEAQDRVALPCCATDLDPTQLLQSGMQLDYLRHQRQMQR